MIHTPSMQTDRIERDHLLDTFIKKKADRNRQQEDLDRSVKESQEILARIRANCSKFKATNPEAWAQFEKDIVRLFGISYSMDRSSPIDFFDRSMERGIAVDSHYWALTKACLSGKLEILNSMLDLFDIDMKKIQLELDDKLRSQELDETFFKKVLTYFSNLINRHQE